MQVVRLDGCAGILCCSSHETLPACPVPLPLAMTARPYIGAPLNALQGRLSSATTTHAWYVSLRKCLWRLYKITFRNEKYALGRVRYWLNLPLFQFLLTFELTCRESVFVWILQPFSSEH